VKYYVHTLGCKFNQYESAQIDKLLRYSGNVRSKPEDADIIVINSCAVTQEASRKSLQVARHFQKVNLNSKIIFTGCVVHDRKVDDFTLILGNGEKLRISDFIDKTGLFSDPIYHLKDDLKYTIEKMPNHTRAFLGIENGCNWGCSYCAIPHFRGTRIRSKPLRTVIKEIHEMIRSGVKEIVLTGINIALYKDGNVDLHDLVESILELEFDFRLRLGSLDPLSAANLSDLFENPKLCHHIHLSMQSGSDDVLKRMNRHYNSQDILKVVKIFKNMDNKFAFSTDVIVGFPGETEKDFRETCDLLKKMQVSRIHVFPFSAKPHTLASTMKGQIKEEIKKKRVKILKSLAQELSKNYLKKLEGTLQRILVERTKNDMVEGLDQYYVRHKIKCEAKEGNFVECKIEGVYS